MIKTCKNCDNALPRIAAILILALVFISCGKLKSFLPKGDDVAGIEIEEASSNEMQPTEEMEEYGDIAGKVQTLPGAEEQAADEALARRSAENKAANEARTKREAEERAADEARVRRETEERAADEARARREAEEQAADEARARREEIYAAAEHTQESTTLASGKSFRVVVSSEVSTRTGRKGDIFEATLDENITDGIRVIAERGSRVRGLIIDTDDGRGKGYATISLQVESLTLVDGRVVNIKTSTHTVSASTAAKDVGIVAGVGSRGRAGVAVIARDTPAVVTRATPMTFRLTSPLTVTF